MKLSEYEKRANELTARCTERFNYAAWVAGIGLLNKEFDKARTPVADAALFLFGHYGFRASALQDFAADEIKECAKIAGFSAHKMGLHTGPVYDGSFSWAIKTKGGAFSGLGIGLSEDALMVDSARIHLVYPKRQETADAAEFLAMRVGIGAYWLKTVGAQHIREDAKDFRKMLKSKEVQVCVTVHSLKEDASGGYIDLKFFKGDVKVGETRIKGKTASPYKRYVELIDDFDRYRVESTLSAQYSLERVKP